MRTEMRVWRKPDPLSYIAIIRMDIRFRNYVDFSHVHGFAVNNSG